MVMECGSCDLAKLINDRRKRGLKLEPYEIVYFWRKMLTAIKTIHDQGRIRHRLQVLVPLVHIDYNRGKAKKKKN